MSPPNLNISDVNIFESTYYRFKPVEIENVVILDDINGLGLDLLFENPQRSTATNQINTTSSPSTLERETMASSSAPAENANVRPFRPSNNEPRYVRGELSFFTVDNSRVVRYGYISPREANQVWTECLDSWDMEDSSPEDRRVAQQLIAQACAVSTSKDDENLNTYIEFGNKRIVLRDIADRVSMYCQSNNDSYLRVWIRSFEGAKIPQMIFDMLSDPANVALRQELAFRAGGPIEHAPYMFDTADAYIRLSEQSLTAQELSLIKMYRSSRTTQAADSARSVGDFTPRNDTSTRNQPIIGAHQKPVPKASAEARMGFAGDVSNFR